MAMIGTYIMGCLYSIWSIYAYMNNTSDHVSSAEDRTTAENTKDSNMIHYPVIIANKQF